jgi:hypothetical protein
MTCIAWDGKTLAGDRFGNSKGVPLEFGKIWEIEGGLVGIGRPWS